MGVQGKKDTLKRIVFFTVFVKTKFSHCVFDDYVTKKVKKKQSLALPPSKSLFALKALF